MNSETDHDIAAFQLTVEQIERMCQILRSQAEKADKMHPSWVAVMAEGPVDTIRQLCDDLDTFICKHTAEVAEAAAALSA